MAKENEKVSFYRNRIGKMLLSKEVLCTPFILEAFKVLDIRVIRAECLAHKGLFEYYFVSEFLESTPEGSEPKTYLIEVTETDFRQKIYKLKEA